MIGIIHLTHAARGVLSFVRNDEYLIPDYEVADVLFTSRKFMKGVLAIHHFEFHEPTNSETKYCQMRDGLTPDYLVSREELEKELEIVCEKLKDVTDAYLQINEKLNNLQKED